MPFKDEKTRRAFFAGLKAKEKQLGVEPKHTIKAEDTIEKAVKKQLSPEKIEKPKLPRLKKILKEKGFK